MVNIHNNLGLFWPVDSESGAVTPLNFLIEYQESPRAVVKPKGKICYSYVEKPPLFFQAQQRADHAEVSYHLCPYKFVINSKIFLVLAAFSFLCENYGTAIYYTILQNCINFISESHAIHSLLK